MWLERGNEVTRRYKLGRRGQERGGEGRRGEGREGAGRRGKERVEV